MCMFIRPMSHYFQLGLPITRPQLCLNLAQFATAWASTNMKTWNATKILEQLQEVTKLTVLRNDQSVVVTFIPYETYQLISWLDSFWQIPRLLPNNVSSSILVGGQQVQRSFSFLVSPSCTPRGCVQNKIKQDWQFEKIYIWQTNHHKNTTRLLLSLSVLWPLDQRCRSSSTPFCDNERYEFKIGALKMPCPHI